MSSLDHLSRVQACSRAVPDSPDAPSAIERRRRKHLRIQRIEDGLPEEVSSALLRRQWALFDSVNFADRQVNHQGNDDHKKDSAH